MQAGYPATSPWWHDTIAAFSASGTRQCVLRVGRRGGKSSSLCRVAVLEALFGGHKVPPGDTGVVAIVSVNRGEATGRLKTIAAILKTLGVKHRATAEEIELVDRNVVFRVFTASLTGVVGFTSICILCDEVALWEDKETGANPAKEILGFLRPTMATIPTARIFLSSSPVGQLDAHYEAFELGDTDAQRVFTAPSWIANPTLTEDGTRELEPNERAWRRQYAAIPQAGTLNCFEPDAIDRAFAPRVGTPTSPILVLDPSSGRKDSFTYATMGWLKPDTGPAYLRVDLIGGIEGAFWQHTAGSLIVERLAGLAAGRKITTVAADQRESLMLASEFSKHHLDYKVHDWTASSKPKAIERIRRLFADGLLSIVDHDKMKKELLGFEERITPSGAFTFGARGGLHDDYVALLLTGALADMAGQIPESPLSREPASLADFIEFRKKAPRTRF